MRLRIENSSIVELTFDFSSFLLSMRNDMRYALCDLEIRKKTTVLKHVAVLLRYTNYLIGGKNSNKSKPLIIRRAENN